MVKWLSPLPDGCEVCGQPFGDKFADAKTIYGPWGLLCMSCLETVGLGVGTGLGQVYDTKTKEKIRG